MRAKFSTLAAVLALASALVSALAFDNSACLAHEQSSVEETRAMLLGKIPNQSSTSNIFRGYSKSDMLKYFADNKIKHNHDATEFSWHGTDLSTVMQVRYERCKVSAIRYITHYGHPRPGKKSDVETSKWLTAKAETTADKISEKTPPHASTRAARGGLYNGTNGSNGTSDLNQDSRPE